MRQGPSVQMATCFPFGKIRRLGENLTGESEKKEPKNRSQSLRRNASTVSGKRARSGHGTYRSLGASGLLPTMSEDRTDATNPVGQGEKRKRHGQRLLRMWPACLHSDSDRTTIGFVFRLKEELSDK